MSLPTSETPKAAATTTTTSPKTSPWAKIQSPISPCSLEDVMSEQLAEHLSLKESGDFNESTAGGGNEGEGGTAASTGHHQQQLTGDPTVDNDHLLAQILQYEYDKEFDEMLKANEKVRNRESRVQISLDKFKSVHPFNVDHEREINEAHHVDLSSETESEDGNI